MAWLVLDVRLFTAFDQSRPGKACLCSARQSREHSVMVEQPLPELTLTKHTGERVVDRIAPSRWPSYPRDRARWLFHGTLTIFQMQLS